MPITLPPKARADVVRTRKHETFVKFDWLVSGLFRSDFVRSIWRALPIFSAGDNIGASLILVGVAAIIAVIVCLGGEPQELK